MYKFAGMFRRVKTVVGVIRRASREAGDGVICNPTPEMEEHLRCRKDSKLEVCLVDDSMVNPCWDNPKVVIVGAGVAGLTAAYRLASSGIQDVTILEATDRPGGRVHSVLFGQTVVEVGADLIEGATGGNSAFSMAAQQHLLEYPIKREESLKGISLTSEGRIIDGFIAQAAAGAFDNIISEMSDLYVRCGAGIQCGSVCSFLCRKIDIAIQAFPSEIRADAGKVMISKMLDFMGRQGGDLKKISACQFGAKYEHPGGSVRVPSGMVGILGAMLKPMPLTTTIKYCKPVGKIIWCEGVQCPRAQVFTCDGDVMIADYVIVTVSLGVLKDVVDTMFDPCLPECKLKAIENMGFGHVTNIYLEYANPFWIWGEGTMNLAWNHNDYTNEKSWIRRIGVIRDLATSQQILHMTIGGDMVPCIEKLSEQEIAEDVTHLIRRFLNNPMIPYPANVLRSKWSSSPYFRGARSFYGLNSTVAVQNSLALPVPELLGQQIPTLLFAGEATVPSDYGTIHGARVSGMREADRIIEMTRKFQGKPSIVVCKEADQDKAALSA